MKTIASDEFNIIAGYIYEISGIYLDLSKTYLVETRLNQLLKETGVSSYHELYRKAKTDTARTLERKIIDAITTRETMFFRDNSPFELLKTKILPELCARKLSQSASFPASLRIWSAGCSTGQEIYSISIVLYEYLFNSKKYNIQLLGTDISGTAISSAISAEYSQIVVERGLPREMLNRYFIKTGEKWKIKNDIRARCSFRKHNLMDSFSGLGCFDIVFCRNVAIYFQHKDKVKLFDKLADIIEPGGYLIIGSSESITGINSRFQPFTHLNMIYYRLK